MKVSLIYFNFLLGMLIYRTQRNARKRRLKLIHGGIMLFTVVLVVVALVAAFDSHNLNVEPIPNMYSLHSWVGLTSVILFCCQVHRKYLNIYNNKNKQYFLISIKSLDTYVHLLLLVNVTNLNTLQLFQWLAGFLSFFYPGLQLPLRTSYMPIHVYFGIAGFVGVIASCLLGLNEKAIFSLK